MGWLGIINSVTNISRLGTFKVKCIRRRRQEYFAVYGEYADRRETEPIPAKFRPKPKTFQILNHYSIHDRIGKKTISRYCPFNKQHSLALPHYTLSAEKGYNGVQQRA